VSRNAQHGRPFLRAAVAEWFIACLFLSLLPAPAHGAAFSNERSAHVVIVEDPAATEAFRPRADRVRAMVDRGVTLLTGKTNVADAWLSLVSTQDVVGIKVHSQPGPNSGTRRSVVAGVIEGLLETGLPPDHIIVWDKEIASLRLSGFFELHDRFGVRVEGAARAGWDENVFYESPILGHVVRSDREFGPEADPVGRKSFVSRLVTKEITRIINVAPMMNHNDAGVTGNLFSLSLGAVDNTARFQSSAERLAVAIPEIYALPELGDRVVLNIVDALICQYEGEERSLLHYSTVLNQLRFSRDPVALDVLSLHELESQRKRADAPRIRFAREIYTNASLLELGNSDTNRIRITQVRTMQ